MAVCLEFELIEVIGTRAKYRFGPCLHDLDGLIELDLFKLKSGEISGDTPINEVVKLINDNQKQGMANKVFSEVFKFFNDHNEYPARGGYYA
ncbi:hypothetical protein [Paenibacillus glycanilyticus]|uniref:Uncharacterized protein n=1 Tax=Paenibacillus glycanilyticus TaxID=126569 RepID=A0ABQ6GCD1_9BACL|nr:hypothetical protein [Paenibacillus glycanilyticus]GLX68626.1 hypothetical protein MU1_29710 [Paenibacillus glycanilyticus]